MVCQRGEECGSECGGVSVSVGWRGGLGRLGSQIGRAGFPEKKMEEVVIKK
jgi:hypothetical protein